jgi:two-component system sensor histidine kinase YesM
MTSILRKGYRSFREKTRNCRLGTKMSALIFGSVLIPLCIAMLLFNVFTGDSLARQARANAQNAFSQLYDIFSSRFDIVKQDTLLLQQDTNIRALLQQQMTGKDILQLVQNKALMNTTFDYIQNRNIWDMRIRVYLPPEKSLLIDNERFYSAATVDLQPWYQNLVAQPYKNGWIYTADGAGTEADAGMFAYTVRVCNPLRFLDTAAVIRFDFSMEKVLHTMTQSLPLVSGATVYLLSGDGQIILQSAYGDSTFQPSPPTWSIPIDQPQWTDYQAGGQQYYLQQQRFRYNPWCLMMALPNTSGIRLLYRNSQWSFILLMTFIGGIGILAFSLLFSQRIVKRLTLVTNGMSNLKDGVLQSLPAPTAHDEIGILIESYNYLTEELNMLNSARAMADSNQKHAEMIALQAQINPHFLYNTLEMINYFAMMGDAKQVERIVMLLSRFYKRCLNQGEEYSTLSQELELTQAYMSIQEIRYSGKIRFVQEVAPELMHCNIPHIVLQPIVENAIHHGIMNNPDQEGTITIRGEKKGDLLLLTVSDDGAGMTEERLHQLNDGLDLQYSMTEVGSHFGLRNIHERLMNLYGEQYGLTFQSSLGVGTTITITIPLCSD